MKKYIYIKNAPVPGGMFQAIWDSNSGQTLEEFLLSHEFYRNSVDWAKQVEDIYDMQTDPATGVDSIVGAWK